MNGLAEFHAVHAQEDRHLARVLQFPQEKHARQLGHRLDDQDARHDGRPGIMALEEVLVDGNILDAHRPDVFLELHNAVHKEEGVPVRQDLHDLADVHGRARLGPGTGGPAGALVLESANQPVVQHVAAFDGHDPAAYVTVQEEQVAHQVQHFVASRLVRKTKRVLNRPLAPEHQQVLVRDLRPVAATTQFLHLGFEDEGAAGGQVFDKRVRRQPQVAYLRRDDALRAVIEMVRQHQRVLVAGERGNDGAAVLHRDRLNDLEHRPIGRLLDDARLPQQPNVIRRRPVARRQFRPVEFHGQVVDLEAFERRQEMLGRLDRHLPVRQRRPLKSLRDRLDRSRNLDFRREVHPREDEPRVGGGRLQADVDRLAGEEAPAFHLGLACDGSLASAHAPFLDSRSASRSSIAFRLSRTSSIRRSAASRRSSSRCGPAG